MRVVGAPGRVEAGQRLSPVAVAQTFLSAGSGDFPVASLPPARNTGQECPVNPQTGMSALPGGSREVSTISKSHVETMNPAHSRARTGLSASSNSDSNVVASPEGQGQARPPIDGSANQSSRGGLAREKCFESD